MNWFQKNNRVIFLVAWLTLATFLALGFAQQKQQTYIYDDYSADYIAPADFKIAVYPLSDSNSLPVYNNSVCCNCSCVNNWLDGTLADGR